MGDWISDRDRERERARERERERERAIEREGEWGRYRERKRDMEMHPKKSEWKKMTYNCTQNKLSAMLTNLTHLCSFRTLK